MKKLKRVVATLVIIMTLAVPSMGVGLQAEAAKGDQGVDWAIYQGAQGRFGYAKDKFAIAQIGGYNANGLYDQWTYTSQVAAAIAQGKRAHTYIWYDTYGSMDIAKTTMDYFLPKIQTPKNSIVALDFEHGASNNKTANTDTILYGMRRIKAAGYTPMYYSYRPFTLQYVDYQHILAEFPDSLWIAAYPNYNVTPVPNYSVFPSMDGVAIYQFTSTYIPGGLDGNVDLTGITDNGYYKSNTPVTETPAVEEGQKADETPKREIEKGFTVKVNFSATNWLVGGPIPQWVKGNSYKVLQTDGTKVLLADIMSWIDRKNVEILQTNDPAPITTTNVHVVQNGETLSGIATRYNTTYQNLAAINGLANPNYIYVGQQLKVTGTAQQARTYVVKSGDNLSTIAANLGTTVQNLAQRNGISNPNLIYPGQTLNY